MDRNQAIGLSLMGLVMVIYFTFFAGTPKPAAVETKAKTELAKTTPADTIKTAAATDTSSVKQALLGDWILAPVGQAPQTYNLENDQVKLSFSPVGGSLLSAELKGYKTYDGKPLVLFTPQSRKFNLTFNDGALAVDGGKLLFSATQSANTISFTATTTNGKQLSQTYTLPKEGYLLDWKVASKGIALAKDPEVSWSQEALPFERDLKAQRISTTINWYEPNDGFNNLGETSTDKEEQTVANAHWVAAKQKFFITALLVPAGLPTVKAQSVTNVEDSTNIKSLAVQTALPAKAITGDGLSMQWYLGPNKFDELKKVATVEDFDKNLYLGWPVINLINRLLTVNVFSWLEHITTNYGLIIIALVLMVRLLLLPLVYRSYVSMAKMRVLKPELDEIKARIGDDMQAQQAEQMKLYQQVGINPLSGCVPLLLQMPVLFAMFNFFPNSIELRQQALWWANDLSTYDDLISWSFNFPFLGHHLSIFNVLLMFSTLGITWFNNQNTANINDQMKIIGYVMPVFLMFVLNDLPAGLNFYYLASNLMSMGQQILFRRFIDEDSLHKKLQENKVKNANKPKSSFAQRLEDVMKQAEAERNNKKKK